MNSQIITINGEESLDQGFSVTLSHILADFNHSVSLAHSNLHTLRPIGTRQSLLDLNISELWDMKEHPTLYPWNMRMNNVSDAYQEIVISSSTVACMVDLTTSSNQRNHISLLSLSNQLHASEKLSHIRIISCTDPGSHSTIAEMIVHMKNDIMLGYDFKTSSTDINGKPIRAGAIRCSLSSHPYISVQMLSSYCKDMIQACAQAQYQLNQYDSIDPHSAPPIIISLGYATSQQMYVDVLDILTSHHALVHQVIFTDIIASSHNINAIEAILQYPGKPCICIDSFGLCATYIPSSMNIASFPTDDEIVNTVCILCDRGYHDQIILSTNIRSKIQMKCYGGHGYDIIETIISKLISSRSLSPDIVCMITCRNMYRLLAWYQPPKPAPKPIDMMTCHICQQSFVPGKHYEKFDHVYCSSACLGKHRQQQWK